MEIWKPIPEYPGYEVSNLGGVRSIDRTLMDKNGRIRKYKGRLLKPTVKSDKCPYPQYTLGFKKSPKPAHQLVMMTFVGSRPSGLLTRHIDGDFGNNTPENLCYGTSLENSSDMSAHGTKGIGEKNAIAILTEAQVVSIRLRIAAGETQVSIAKDLGVCKATINCIHLRKTWGHI